MENYYIDTTYDHYQPVVTGRSAYRNRKQDHYNQLRKQARKRLGAEIADKMTISEICEFLHGEE